MRRLQNGVGARVRVVLSGSSDRPHHTRADPFDGLAGPGSAMWVVHGDVATIVGGLRALLVQSLHPLAVAGVVDYSDYRQDPLGRLHRTAAFLGDVVFGSVNDANRAIDAVKKMHQKVNGVAPDGRSYAASDPHLLSWVHCTLIESFWQSRVRYGTSPLPPGSADRYVAEMAGVGHLLGVEDPPTSAAELTSRLTSFMPELEVNHQARDILRFLLWPKLPFVARVPYTILLGAAIGMLPEFVCQMLGVRFSRNVDLILVYPSAKILLRMMRWALGPHPEISAADSEFQ
ncbi:MAG: oxygenase MpaB family protein [Acidimicrobiaceae bacterium]|nr:oxygenase MpaB family protein [Acidimicrobiaceae bacterium]